MTESPQAHRKDEHLSLGVSLWRDTTTKKQIGASFDDIRWLPNTFPEMGIEEVDMTTNLFQHQFNWPFYIEAMTGGSALTGRINGQLATVSANTGLAMAVGSQSIALKEPSQAPTFKIVRQRNPEGVSIMSSRRFPMFGPKSAASCCPPTFPVCANSN